uniref:Putative ixodes 10 kDa peptide protein n=1 Tax=Ixodes ricinus TaxID=34613 RepID=A0A0K8RC64_IXORI
MLLMIFATVLIFSAVQNGVISDDTRPAEHCMALIKQIGNVACHLIGEEGYYRLGLSTCLISCTGGTYPIQLPERTCDRILEPDSWNSYVQVYNELPPKEFEYCDQQWYKKLQDWLNAWRRRNETMYNSICKRNAS